MLRLPSREPGLRKARSSRPARCRGSAAVSSSTMRRPTLRWSVTLVGLGAVSLAVACAPNDLPAVGAPGGVYQPGAGCGVEALGAGGPASCQTGAQWGFEQVADQDAFVSMTTNLTRPEVTCRRSFCGTGSLHFRADYHARAGQPMTEMDRFGELSHRLPRPMDLYGKMLAWKLFIDGPETPVNAQISVIDDRGLWHRVHDGPVYGVGRWHERGAPIRADNPMLAPPPEGESLVVAEIRIAVYLATPVMSGDHEHWSGDVYVDEVGWY
jgi:hypothetical protein